MSTERSQNAAGHQVSPSREKALLLLEKISVTRPEFDALNDSTRAIYGDFYPHLSPIAPPIYEALLALLDEELDDMASYFLHDLPDDGGKVTIGDRSWKIENVDDIRVYLSEKDA